MKTLAKLTLTAALLGTAPFAAQVATATEAAGSTAATGQLTEGEIRKVDKDAKKITIKHGELKNLEMPAMTMVFQVKDSGMLEKVRQGDKVSFVAEKFDGKFTITQIDVKQ